MAVFIALVGSLKQCMAVHLARIVSLKQRKAVSLAPRRSDVLVGKPWMYSSTMMQVLGHGPPRAVAHPPTQWCINQVSCP